MASNLAWIHVSILLAACGGGDSAVEVVRTDSAGVEIVVSPAQDRPLQWTFEPAFRIGGQAEGPASFTSVRYATVGADSAGNAYVLDGGAHRVVVFAPDGSHLRTMGSEGGGPGELQFPIGMAVSPGGEAAVFDIGKGSLVWFDAAGAPLPEVPFAHFTEPGVIRHFAVTDESYVVAKGFAGGAEGRAIELRAWPRDASAFGSDTTVFARMDLPAPETADFGCIRLRIQPIFFPVLQWDARDGVVAAIPSGRYRVDLYTSDGTRVRSIRRDMPPRPATREHALAEVGRGLRMSGGAGSCEATPEEVVEERGFAERLPALANVAIAPGGEIWVERFRPGASAERTSGSIDVFDATGAYLGTLPEGTPFPLAFLSDDRIAISERDALDVERLVVLRVNRAAS